MIRELKYIILRGVIVNSSLIRRVLRKWLLIYGFWLLVVLPILGQANGDYRSLAVGPANWGNAGSWEMYDGTVWSPAAFPPTLLNNVTIRSGHTIILNFSARTCKNLIVETTAQLTGDRTISIYGNFINNGSITTSAGNVILRGISGTIDGSGVVTLFRRGFQNS